MKKLLTLLLLSPLAFADYKEMISLEDYIAENSMEDLSVLLYVTTRCSGLFSVAASLYAPESENHQRFLATAKKFYTASINVRGAIDQDTESKEHEDKTFKTVQPLPLGIPIQLTSIMLIKELTSLNQCLMIQNYVSN